MFEIKKKEIVFSLVDVFKDFKRLESICCLELEA